MWSCVNAGRKVASVAFVLPIGRRDPFERQSCERCPACISMETQVTILSDLSHDVFRLKFESLSTLSPFGLGRKTYSPFLGYPRSVIKSVIQALHVIAQSYQDMLHVTRQKANLPSYCPNPRVE